MKLVRAKWKSLETLPLWAKCCESAIEIANTSANKQLTVDLNNNSIITVKCLFCMQIRNPTMFVTNIEDKGWVALAEVDLDEGEYIPT